jgi:hypothetical protein
VCEKAVVRRGEVFDDNSRDIRSNQAGEHLCAVRFRVRRCGIWSVLIELLDCRVTAALEMSSSLVSVAINLSSLLSCGAAFLGLYMLLKVLHGLRPRALLFVGLAARFLPLGVFRRQLLCPLRRQITSRPTVQASYTPCLTDQENWKTQREPVSKLLLLWQSLLAFHTVCPYSTKLRVRLGAD